MFGLDPRPDRDRVEDFVACIHPDDLEPTLKAALEEAKVPGRTLLGRVPGGQRRDRLALAPGLGRGRGHAGGRAHHRLQRRHHRASGKPSGSPWASEAFTRSILESSPDCIKVLSLDGRLDFFSDGGLCAMEVDDFDRQIRGTEWVTFWQPEDQPKVRAALADGAGRRNGALSGVPPDPEGHTQVVGRVGQRHPRREWRPREASGDLARHHRPAPGRGGATAPRRGAGPPAQEPLHGRGRHGQHDRPHSANAQPRWRWP